MTTAKEVLDKLGMTPGKYPPENPDCAECRKYSEEKITFHPRHTPSSYCESGKRPHCTCPICWG